MKKRKSEDTFIYKVATFIIDKRKAFYLLFAVVLVFCAICIPKVKVNSDLSSYLPKDAETRKGYEIMTDEFKTFANAQIMISNITYEKAKSFADEFAKLDGIMMVTFPNDIDHYVNSSALIMVNFAGEATDPKIITAMGSIKESLENYDVAYSTEVGDDLSKTLVNEMATILIIAAIVIIAVLLLTSKSYLELLVFFIVFIVAAVLNLGTNYDKEESSYNIINTSNYYRHIVYFILYYLYEECMELRRLDCN